MTETSSDSPRYSRLFLAGAVCLGISLVGMLVGLYGIGRLVLWLYGGAPAVQDLLHDTSLAVPKATKDKLVFVTLVLSAGLGFACGGLWLYFLRARGFLTPEEAMRILGVHKKPRQ